MENFIKLFILICFFTFNADITFANHINSLIKSSPLDKTSTVAVSVKDTETGKTVYQYNEQKLLHPASTLKVFTTVPALDTLEADYDFRTNFYVRNNNLYVKLSGDPLLSSENLKNALKDIKAAGYRNFNNVYIDDSVLDNVEFGVGWMWDDSTNKYVRKFSAYNLDNNILNIRVYNDNGVIKTDTTSIYKVPVICIVSAGDKTNLTAIRHDWISPDIIFIKGTVNGSANIQVPINNMQKYFNYRLYATMKKVNIKVANDVFLNGNVPDDATCVVSVTHPVSPVIPKIFKDSSNKDCETLVKIAGGVSENSKGTLENSINLFFDYWNAKSVDTSDVVLADASGVSRNNLITTDFMTNALNVIYKDKGFDNVSELFAQPGDGTLSNRLLNLRGSVWLKTGTLENISGLTGYVKTDKGKIYSVAILIQNFNCPQIQIKEFENEIITLIKNL